MDYVCSPDFIRVFLCTQMSQIDLKIIISPILTKNTVFTFVSEYLNKIDTCTLHRGDSNRERKGSSPDVNRGNCKALGIDSHNKKVDMIYSISV